MFPPQSAFVYRTVTTAENPLLSVPVVKLIEVLSTEQFQEFFTYSVCEWLIGKLSPLARSFTWPS